MTASKYVKEKSGRTRRRGPSDKDQHPRAYQPASLDKKSRPEGRLMYPSFNGIES